jgi:alkylation response protein AidB-like acyl-CoA dehydrogenase
MLYRLERLREDLATQGRNDTYAANSFGRAYLAVSALRARSAQTVRRLSTSSTVGPEASADKILLATAEQLVLDTARELLGDQFIFSDSPADIEWRAEWQFSRAASIYGGAGEIQRAILADRVLQLPKE